MDLTNYHKIEFFCSICKREIRWCMAGGNDKLRRKVFRLTYNQNGELICQECSFEEIDGIDKIVYFRLFNLEKDLKGLLKYKSIGEYKEFIDKLIEDLDNKQTEIYQAKDIYGWNKYDEEQKDRTNWKREYQKLLKEKKKRNEEI